MDKDITLRYIAGATSGAGKTYPSRNTPSSLLSWFLMESKLCVFVFIKYLGFESTSYWILFHKCALRTKLDIYVLIIIVLSTSLYFYSDLRDYQFFVSSVDFIKSVGVSY